MASVLEMALGIAAQNLAANPVPTAKAAYSAVKQGVGMATSTAYKLAQPRVPFSGMISDGTGGGGAPAPSGGGERSAPAPWMGGPPEEGLLGLPTPVVIGGGAMLATMVGLVVYKIRKKK